MIKDHLKSPKAIILISMAITFIVILIKQFFLNTDQLSIEFGILSVLSLFLGPYAVLGFIIAEIFNWILYYKIYNIPILLISAIQILILGIVPWKIWYSITRYGTDVPNMNSLYSFIKILLITFSTLVQYLLFFRGAEWTITTDLKIGYELISLMLMLIIMGVFSKYNLHYYTPKKQLINIKPKKLYPILVLISSIIVIILSFYNGIINEYLKYILLVLITIFLVTPFEKEVFEINDTIKANIFYKVCISIFFVLMIILLIISVPLSIGANLQLKADPLSVPMPLEILFNLFLVLLIPLIIYMFFLEKQVINPIKKLSHYLSKEINNYDDFNELKSNLNSITVNNEIKSLSESLLNIENELVDYGQNLIEITKETERYETELGLAHEIQYALVPTNFKEFYGNKDFELWGLMEAAREVGGDFYDYFEIDEENIGFVIGDVSGKGVSAALVMVKAVTLIEFYAKNYEDLSEVFFEVNNELCQGNGENVFVTCWLGKLNIKTGQLTFVNAGHNPPLIKQDNGDFKYLETEPELVLAIMENMPYATHSIQLQKNDALFLYTDGVTEANDQYNGFYGEDRLQSILNKHKDDDVNIIINAVEDDINQFCNNHEQFDDTTIFIIQKK